MHHIIVKTNLFYIGGLVEKLSGSGNLKKIGGLYKVYPWLGVLFLIPAMSLAGIPPLSGFWSKFIIVKASFTTSEYAVAGVALFVGLLTLFSMTKIWNEVFWKNRPESSLNDTADFSSLRFKEKFCFILPIVLLATITISIGLFVEDVFSVANTAAGQLTNPSLYRQAVLGLR
jgi:multicomponent Na+:H+ antiporter subunit D